MAVDEPRYSIRGCKTHVLAVEVHGAVCRLLAEEPVEKLKAATSVERAGERAVFEGTYALSRCQILQLWVVIRRLLRKTDRGHSCAACS
jgi:hypothetical protein